MESFANPQLLWLLLLVIPMGGYYIFRLYLGGASIRISSTEGVRKAPRTWRYFLRHLPIMLRLAAVVLMIVALARPQKIKENQTRWTEGIDIVVALDISGSMLARDFTPDRLTAAKIVAGEFIAEREGDNIALVAFAGEAYSPTPLTSQREEVQTAIARLQSGIIEDGTAIGNGLATAINRLRDSKSKSKVIILLTDGVNNRGEISPLMAADIAKEMNIKVYTIGVGKEGYAPYPAYDMFGNLIYQQMKVEIDEKTLSEIAEKTGGRYYRATNENKLKEIYAEVDQMEKSAVEIFNQIKIEELFLKWILAALGLLLAEWIIEKVLLKRLP